MSLILHSSGQISRNVFMNADRGAKKARLFNNYSPRFTEPEANNCFSLIFRGEYRELKNEELKDDKKHLQCSLAYV